MARKIKTRKQNKTILLIVEGKTEQIYFSQLKSYERLVGLTLKPKLIKNSSPYYILKEALEAQKENVYDFIWCVFDKDVLSTTKPRDFDLLYARAEKKKINFAESLPCFEVWLLLHFILPAKYFANAEAVEIELCKHLKGYCKESKWLQRSEIYNILKKHQKTAISNAKILSDRNLKNSASNASFSDIFKLIESILS